MSVSIIAGETFANARSVAIKMNIVDETIAADKEKHVISESRLASHVTN